MIYVQIKAGLGNQMFQYAFGRALSIKRNEPLALDISWYENQSAKDTRRSFLLDKYPISARIASAEELKIYKKPWRMLLRKILRRLNYKKDFIFHPSLFKSKQNYFEGHWSNEKYFKKYEEIIRKELIPIPPLSFEAETLYREIKELISQGIIPISIHVRRGDCVTNPHAANYQGTVDTTYYDKAYEYIASKFNKDKIVFFLFSDDIEWAKNNILPYAKKIFVSCPEIPAYEEAHLMSKCTNHIIANSSFSWWSAWLNPNPEKIVIAPARWLKDTSFDTSDVCPEEWIRI